MRTFNGSLFIDGLCMILNEMAVSCLLIVMNTLVCLNVQNHGGVILNISATLHYNGQVFQAHAGSAKAAIGGFEKHSQCLLLLFSNS